MLRKAMFAMMFSVMIFAGGASAAEEIKDVSKDFWAYDSIKMLVDKGYIAVYEDHTFRGDQALTRTVFAAALGKLIEQIEGGQLKAGGTDMKELKRMSDVLNGNMSEYDTKLKAVEQRLKDIESGNVVVNVDLSKATVEFRDKFDKLVKENQEMKKELAMLEDELKIVSGNLDSETKKRKSATNTLWIGVLGAIAAGFASN